MTGNVTSAASSTSPGGPNASAATRRNVCNCNHPRAIAVENTARLTHALHCKQLDPVPEIVLMTATIAAVRALRVEIATAAVRVHHLHVEIATAAVLAHVHDRHAATAAVLRAVTAAVLLAVTAVAHRPPLQLHRHPRPSLVLRLAPVAAIAVAPAPHHLPKVRDELSQYI